MQCNYNSFIQIINLHGLFRNALRCRKTGACRILVPLRYCIHAQNTTGFESQEYKDIKISKIINWLFYTRL